MKYDALHEDRSEASKKAHPLAVTSAPDSMLVQTLTFSPKQREACLTKLSVCAHWAPSHYVASQPRRF